jgi:hypothetical protein
MAVCALGARVALRAGIAREMMGKYRETSRGFPTYPFEIINTIEKGDRNGAKR